MTVVDHVRHRTITAAFALLVLAALVLALALFLTRWQPDVLSVEGVASMSMPLQTDRVICHTAALENAQDYTRTPSGDVLLRTATCRKNTLNGEPVLVLLVD